MFCAVHTIELPLAVKFHPSTVNTEVASLFVDEDVMFTYGDKLFNGFSIPFVDTDFHVIEDRGTLTAMHVAINEKELETLFNTMRSNGNNVT